jgi:hypothetical protein
MQWIGQAWRKIMDKIIKITLGLFIIILIAFTSVLGYNAYVTQEFLSTSSGTTIYTCTITSDSILSNVTFFIPVPADPGGSSPIIRRISEKDISGLPAGWQTTILDSGKGTMVKITTPSIRPPAGTAPGARYDYTFSVNVTAKTLEDTKSPMETSMMFRPVQDQKNVQCPAELTNIAGSPTCYEYLTTIYADYDAVPNATVIITSSLDVKNEWTIFSPEYSEYRADIFLLMFGANHGWVNTRGSLITGLGTPTPVSPPTLF